MNATAGPAPVPRFLYGTAWKEADTQRCVEEALDAGFRGIDTANQRRHYHEAGVGAALEGAYARGRLLARGDVFLQTKFTPRGGQDHRLPYDPEAPLATQVQDSFARSLEHLATDWLDSYVLHGPSRRDGLGPEDWEIWNTMEALHDEGLVQYLGASNVTLGQLRELCDGARVKPAFVQNRCFARLQWDKEIREYCRTRAIVYQGFSLLTANGPVLQHPALEEIARRLARTPAQIVFRFALEVGMLPLTGTTDPVHMREDLEVLDFELDAEDVVRIERLGVA